MLTEVTVAQFRTFADTTGYRTTAEQSGFSWTFALKELSGLSWRNPEFPQDERHPVVHVSWGDAAAFCLSVDGRLPTEAEWEYAARGGIEGMTFVWGNGLPVNNGQQMANVGDEAAQKAGVDSLGVFRGYDDGYVYTAPAGTFAPNGFGLFDMAGNVYEWVADTWVENRDVSHVIRGGSFRMDPTFGATSSRTYVDIPFSKLMSQMGELGFRCARGVLP
jgi:formylglycine-generating enzyme required for sulfatase activity